MSRRLSRGQARKLREARYWPEQLEAAPNAADRTAVAFDWARARIWALPPAEQDAAWRELVEQLNRIAPAQASSHVNSHAELAVNSGSTDRRARARTRTREREPGTAIRRHLPGHGTTEQRKD